MQILRVDTLHIKRHKYIFHVKCLQWLIWPFLCFRNLNVNNRDTALRFFALLRKLELFFVSVILYKFSLKFCLPSLFMKSLLIYEKKKQKKFGNRPMKWPHKFRFNLKFHLTLIGYMVAYKCGNHAMDASVLHYRASMSNKQKAWTLCIHNIT